VIGGAPEVAYGLLGLIDGVVAERLAGATQISGASVCNDPWGCLVC
jgi:hypothetical protein